MRTTLLLGLLALTAACALLLPASRQTNANPLAGGTVVSVSGGNAVAAADAVCNETGTIAIDTHWTSSCVHVVVDGITISPGVTFTIEPGTIVKLVNPSNLPTITVQGSLIAQGTAQDPVMLTSYRDDTAGGDSNGDGTASSAAPGDWNFIYVSSGSSAVFDHVMVRFGGRPPSCLGPCGFTVGGVITNIFGSSPDPDFTFTHSTVSDSANTGVAMDTSGSVTVTDSNFIGNQGTGLSASSGLLRVTGSRFDGNRIGAWLSGRPSSVVAGNTFADNTSDGLRVWRDTVPVDNIFTNNQGYAIVAEQPFWTERSSPLFRGNTANGNRFNAILLDLGNDSTVTTETNTLAANPGVPYVVNSLTIPLGATLTLEAGTILKLTNTSNLPTIGVHGSLVAVGTAQEPIILTSIRDDIAGGDTNGDGESASPLVGDWTFIFLYSGDSSVGSSATFDHAAVRYGGRPTSCIGPCPVPQGVITNLVGQPFGAPPTIDPGASLSFANGTLSDAANTGINVVGASASAAISQSRLLTGTSVAVAAGGGAAVDARNNWWGNASGPSPADSSCTTAAGSGSKVGCGLLFDPWLTSDPGQTTPPAEDRKVIFIQGIDSKSWAGEVDGQPDCSVPENAANADNLGFVSNRLLGQDGNNRVQWMADYLTSELGYEANDDIFYFSYRSLQDGGYCPQAGDPSSPDFRRPRYEPEDTCTGIDGVDGAAGKLQILVSNLISEYPGAKFDVIAHSMGGLVAAYWLSQHPQSADRIHSVITFDSPLRGTHLRNGASECEADSDSWQQFICYDYSTTAACPVVGAISQLGSGQGGLGTGFYTLDATQQDFVGEAVPGDRTTLLASDSKLHCKVDDNHTDVWEDGHIDGSGPFECWKDMHWQPASGPVLLNPDGEHAKEAFFACAVAAPADASACFGNFGTEVAPPAALPGPAPAASTEVSVTSTDGFLVGDWGMFNPGMPNEETHQIVGIASLILATPLQFDHEAGEPVIKVNAPPDDSDSDGCTDEREDGSDPLSGGLRDPLNFWDFFDTPDEANARDRAITVGDNARVAERFGTYDAGSAFFDRTSDPLEMPDSPPSYHPAFDRDGSPPGADPWDLRPPNGSITAGDIGAVVAQFGHSCA
ncbi:MAG: flexitail domain-containing putative surface protein [Dehalococcoidia bacterium]